MVVCINSPLKRISDFSSLSFCVLYNNPAALNLGCVARRSSRSQRYSNPRCYLSPITSDVPCVSPSIVEKGSQRDNTSNSQCTPHCSNIVKPITISSIHLGSESTMKFASASENVPPSGYDQCSPGDVQATSNFLSYPLYYGNCPQFEELKHDFGILPKPVSNPLEPATAKMSVIPNLCLSGDKSKNNAQTDTRDYPDQSPDTRCDLSLRLGPLSSRCPGSENNSPQEVKDVGAEEGKRNDQSPYLHKELSFLPQGNKHGPIHSYSSPWSFKGEFMNVQSTMRKRKADVNHPTEDSKFCRQPELPFSRLTGSMGNGGL